MEKKRKRLYFIPMIIAIVFGLAALVMLLWNSILTDLFHFKSVSYFQALGLLILCKILFGSMRGGPSGHFRQKGAPWRSKLMNLSDEEREKFRREWKQRAADRGEGEKNC